MAGFANFAFGCGLWNPFGKEIAQGVFSLVFVCAFWIIFDNALITIESRFFIRLFI